ncbi:MAG: trigger factor [Methylococcaceae bacterium]|nr:trigger factor [Methylococcaceae bacterium]MCI0668078.1 trigger factor [Methylococcaceae bacterium]MCI0734390.1 trigger factor [Methylococcaceae bacterium]
MQISVEQTSELKRKLKVQVPEDTIQSECAKRIDSLARTVKLDGFRPGKVPIGLIRKRYGESVRIEVVGQLIRSTLFDALNDHHLRPAGVPLIEHTVHEAGKGLEFEASFEVYPSIRLSPYQALNIVRPVCEISESDIDAAVEKLRRQQRNWRTVEREAGQNDKLMLSFSGSVEGESFSEGPIDDFEVEIGAGQMIPGFENNLIGLQAGGEKTFTLRYPEDYGDVKFAGKSAEFTVRVQKVEESVLPDLDAEFFKRFGIESGDPGEFRSSLKERLEKQKNRAIQARTKSLVMDAMLQANTVTLPEVMVEQEIEQLKKQHSPKYGDSETQLSEEQLAYYESQARRRVKLALLLAEIIAQNSLKADRDRVFKVVQDLAQGFNSPDSVVDWYYSDPEQLKPIEQLVLEDQVADLILAGAQVTDEPVEFASLTSVD